MVDIHNRKSSFENVLEKIQESQQLSNHNQGLIQEFIEAHKAQDRSYDRMKSYVYSFKRISQQIDFKLDEAQQEDINKVVGYVNKEMDYSAHTKNEARKTLNNFYSWFLDNPGLVDDISTTVSKKNRKKLRPETILRPREVKDILRNANNKRDKALIMTTWASGGRIEAVLSVKWNDVSMDQQKTKLRFPQNKTEKRTVFVSEAYPYLKAYAESVDHEPGDFVFQSMSGNHKSHRSFDGGLMSYQAAKAAFDRAVDQADVPGERETTPHKFRKSRATYFAAIGQSAQFLMDFFGWSSYEHAEKYVNLVQEDMEQSYYDAIGLDAEAEGGFTVEEEELKPKSCLTCGSIVSPAMKSCWNCSDNINPDNLLSALEPEDQKSQEKQELKEELLSLADKFDVQLEDM